MMLNTLLCISFILLGIVEATRSNARVSMDDIDLHPILYGFGTPEPKGAQRYWIESHTAYIDLSLVPGGFPLDHLWEFFVHSEFAGPTSHACEYSIGFVDAANRDDMSTYQKHVVRSGGIAGTLSEGIENQIASGSVLFLRGDEVPGIKGQIERSDINFIYVHIDSCFLSRYAHRYQFNRWNQGAYLMDWGTSPIGESWEATVSVANNPLDGGRRWATASGSFPDGGRENAPIARDSTIFNEDAGWWRSRLVFDFRFFAEQTDLEFVLDLWFYSFKETSTNRHVDFENQFCDDDTICGSGDFTDTDETIIFVLEDGMDTMARVYFDYIKSGVQTTTIVPGQNFVHRLVPHTNTDNPNNDLAFPPYAKMWDKNFHTGSPQLLDIAYASSFASHSNDACRIDNGATTRDNDNDIQLYYSSPKGVYHTIHCEPPSTAKRNGFELVFPLPKGVDLLPNPYFTLSIIPRDGTASFGLSISATGNPAPLFEIDHPETTDEIAPLPYEVQISLGETFVNPLHVVTIRKIGEVMGFQGFLPVHAGHRDLCSVNPCVHGKCYPYYSKAMCVCEDGWKGETCSEDEIECNAHSCFNGGACVDRVGAHGFDCTCTSGWAGDRCERASNNCPVQKLDQPQPEYMCLNSGRCTTGKGNSFVCDCTGTGYEGEWCEKSLSECPAGYCGTGVCVPDATHTPFPFYCDCSTSNPAMVGDRCETHPLCAAHPCMHGGICAVHDGKKDCTCPSNFFGDNCEDRIVDYKSDCRFFGNDCGNRGMCVENDAGHHRCECSPYWAGDHCDTHFVCEHNPCQNGGHCSVDMSSTTTDRLKQPVCACTGNWFGNLCTESLADYFDDCRFSPTPCTNGGKCSLVDARDGSQAVYKCIGCAAGWTGQFCEVPYVCTHDNGGCMNGASCSMGDDGKSVCTCLGEWVGEKCDHKLDDLTQTVIDSLLSECRFSDVQCMNGGSCVTRADGSFACVCGHNSMFTGDHCDVPKVCEPNPCMNHGVCHMHNDEASCVCSGEHVGDRCQWTLQEYFSFNCNLKPCENNGVCSSDGKCVCDSNMWVGEWCEIAVVCQTHECHGGECSVDANGAPICICPGNMFGASCQFDRNFHTDFDCRTLPCLNGGTCGQVFDTNTFMCNCLTSSNGGSWTGPRCDVPPACNPNPCHNGGECTVDADGHSACLCSRGWIGDLCDTTLQQMLAAVGSDIDTTINNLVTLRLLGSSSSATVEQDVMVHTKEIAGLQVMADDISEELEKRDNAANAAVASVQGIYDNFSRKDDLEEVHALITEIVSPASSVVASFFTIFVFALFHLF